MIPVVSAGVGFFFRQHLFASIAAAAASGVCPAAVMVIFVNTGCLIGILIMVYYDPHITG